MDKQNTDYGNLSGAPTAILYMGMFAAMGCLSLCLLVLYTSAFFWVWRHFCNWSVVSVILPSHVRRIGVGVALYLLTLGLVYVKLRKSEGITEREAARRRQKEAASMPQNETDRAQNKEAAPAQQNESVHVAQGEPQSPPNADTAEVAVGAQAAAVPQNTGEAAPQMGLRFDGVYVAEEDSGRLNDYATGALVTGRERSFLRFYPNGRVCSTSRKFPVTAPAHTLLTPEEAFVKLEQSGPAHGSAYTFTDDNLSFQVGAEDYQVTRDGLSLWLTYFTKPDPYGDGMGNEVVIRFDFVKTV